MCCCWGLPVKFLVYEHMVCPECESPRISKAVVDILTAEDYCDKFVFELCIFIKDAEARSRGVGDTSLDTLKALDSKELIGVDPHHAVGYLFI